MYPRSKSKGFTIVELLVVVALVALLANTIAIVAIRKVNSAMQLETVAAMKDVVAAAEAYKDDYNGYPFRRDSRDLNHNYPIEGMTDTDGGFIAALAGFTQESKKKDLGFEINYRRKNYLKMQFSHGDNLGLVTKNTKSRPVVTGMLDSWGEGMYFCFDENYDGKAEVFIGQHTSAIRGGLVLISTGGDAVFDMKNDVVSNK